MGAQIAKLPGKQEHGEVPDVTRDLILLIALSFIPRSLAMVKICTD